MIPDGERHLLRAFPAKPITLVRGRNTELWDDAGRRFLDFGGASHGVALLGHNHPRITAALQRQADQLIHVAQGIPNPERGLFLERLHAALPADLTHTFIANSGTEAVECALKLAVAATGRTRFVAAQNAFHGRTVGAVATTHRPAFRTPFQPILAPTDFVPFNDVAALEAAVTADTAAIILEPLQGEGGVQSATPEFLQAARRLATERGAILVFDEVQSGLGRTGTFLASQASGVVPDAVTLAKGLAGGLAIGTCSVTAALAAKLPPGGHGSTYGGNPLACAVGAEALAVLADEALAERAARLGALTLATIEGWAHPIVRAVRGSGLMVGLELRVRPQGVMDALAKAGILVLAGGTTGLRLLPPLTVTEAELAEALEALRRALDAAIPTAGSAPVPDTEGRLRPPAPSGPSGPSVTVPA